MASTAPGPTTVTKSTCSRGVALPTRAACADSARTSRSRSRALRHGGGGSGSSGGVVGASLGRVHHHHESDINVKKKVEFRI